MSCFFSKLGWHCCLVGHQTILSYYNRTAYLGKLGWIEAFVVTHRDSLSVSFQACTHSPLYDIFIQKLLRFHFVVFLYTKFYLSGKLVLLWDFCATFKLVFLCVLPSANMRFQLLRNFVVLPRVFFKPVNTSRAWLLQTALSMWVLPCTGFLCRARNAQPGCEIHRMVVTHCSALGFPSNPFATL